MGVGYLATVIGLVCFIEGLPYLACPGQLKLFMERMVTLPARSLRIFGGVLMVLGLLLVYWGRHHGG